MKSRALVASLILKVSFSFQASYSLSANRQQTTTAVYGGSKIERLGPPADDAEVTPPFFQEDEAVKEEIEIPDLSMEEILSPSAKCDVNQMGPTALAYIGDVVFELFVRSKMVWPTRKTSALQIKVVSLVRGGSVHRFCYTKMFLYPYAADDI